MEGLVNPDASFWKDKKVLVTGHTGFKGAWLVLWLRRLGAQVSGLALAPDTNPSLFELLQDTDTPSEIVDIRDAAAVTRAVKAAEPEIIFHLAAQSLVRPSYAAPADTYATNVMGLVYLLEAARTAGRARAIVNVTSDKCYENREWVWAYRENDALGGHDPYSSSKACAEIVTSAYRRSFFRGNGDNIATALASARAGNVIGGGDWAADRILPDCVRAFSAGKPVTVRNPGSTRPWQHVLEPLCGYIVLAEKLHAHGGDFAEAWNFGPAESDAASVSRVVEMVIRLWGDGASWLTENTPQAHEAGALKVDASKARARLRWHPRLTLDQALDWTVTWYKQQAGGGNAKSLSLAQIENYEAMG